MHAPWSRPVDDSLAWLLLSWRGRIDRRTWWLWSVAALIGLAAYLTMVLRIAGLSAGSTEHAVNLLLLWPFLALSAKRRHDRGKSAWWVLVALIPVVGWLWLLVENGMLPGPPDTNRYGAPPRQ